MAKLKELQQEYLGSNAKAEDILKKIFDIYLISDYILNLHDLSIEYCDYEIYKLRENRACIYEGSKTDCLEIAYEIINKPNLKLKQL
jgi:hypothetical protein